MTINQLNVLYAIKTLKLPVRSSIAKVANISVDTASDVLDILCKKKRVERSSYSGTKYRYIYFLTPDGRRYMEELSRKFGSPVLDSAGVIRTEMSFASIKPDGVALARTFVRKDAYVPEQAYYRNDGNKHIPSRGMV